MEEFVGQLNGVDFRSRHNNYRLKRPSDNEDIEFPGVPPEVTSQPNLTSQIEEMRQWFKAWHYSDTSVRDYRPYFKPVLCYLEGFWSNISQKELMGQERGSQFQASRFEANTGRKTDEHYFFRPTRIVDFKDGMPNFANWDYRILCQNLSRDVPLNALRVVNSTNPEDQATTDRFEVNPPDNATSEGGELLDMLMSEIPASGDGGKLIDDAFGLTAFPANARSDSEEPLNAAFYHRFFKVFGPDGPKTLRRSSIDRTAFFAMTNDPKVSPVSVRRGGKTYTQRWIHSIPTELIYLTPLQTWNPYNLTHHGSADTAEGEVVTADSRNGSLSKDMAFNGTNSEKYYLTPVEFFLDGQTSTDKADAVGVLDQNGNVRAMAASGIRTYLLYIPSVGEIRQSYTLHVTEGDPPEVHLRCDDNMTEEKCKRKIDTDAKILLH